MRILCTTVMRNEAPFILEWLAYHRLIGVSDFLIYSNDCDDGTDVMLDHLQSMGLVTHLNNPRSGKKTVQWKALSRADVQCHEDSTSGIDFSVSRKKSEIIAFISH